MVFNASDSSPVGHVQAGPRIPMGAVVGGNRGGKQDLLTWPPWPRPVVGKHVFADVAWPPTTASAAGCVNGQTRSQRHSQQTGGCAGQRREVNVGLRDSLGNRGYRAYRAIRAVRAYHLRRRDD